MAAWQARRGATFFLPSAGPDHLYFVLCDPRDFDHHPKQCIVVVGMFTLRLAQQERTVILDVGDHTFTKQPSYVDFSSATVKRAIQIEGGGFRRHDGATQDLIDRIVSGLAISKRTPRYIKDLLPF